MLRFIPVSEKFVVGAVVLSELLPIHCISTHAYSATELLIGFVVMLVAVKMCFPTEGL